MPWKPRRDRSFYYKAARIKGEPRHLYLGFGPAGKQHELLDRVEKRRKLAARAERKALAAEMADDSHSWRLLSDWLRTLTASTLLLSGWYRHHGQWRKVMGRPRTRQENVPPLSQEDGIALQSRLNSLNERANAGEPGAIEELREFLEEHPEIWETIGDLNKVSVSMWLTRLLGTESLNREAMTIGLEEWKEELLGPDPSPIERAAGDAMVTAKLSLAYAESQAGTGGVSNAAAALRSKRLVRAQHQFNSTLKLLSNLQLAREKRHAPPVPKHPLHPQAKPFAKMG